MIFHLINHFVALQNSMNDASFVVLNRLSAYENICADLSTFLQSAVGEVVKDLLEVNAGENATCAHHMHRGTSNW